jgi:hypothetical protein
MTGGDLHEGRAHLAGCPLGFAHEQVADATLPGTGIDDEREHAHDPIVVLEARQRVEGHEAEQLALVVGDDDPRIARIEPLQAAHDVRRSGRIAFVGEEGRDSVGVVGRRRAEQDAGLIDHASMVTGRSGFPGSA